MSHTELDRVTYTGGDPMADPSLIRRMQTLFDATRGKATHLRMSAPAITDYMLSIGPSATATLVRIGGDEDDGRKWFESHMASLRERYGDGATPCHFNGLPVVRDTTLPPDVVVACA